MAIYMKWDGIDGAVTTKEFEKWIELDSFQFGVGRAIGTAARGAATREASEPSISDAGLPNCRCVNSNQAFFRCIFRRF